MDKYWSKLREVVFYKGEKIPETLSQFEDLQWDETANSCDPAEYMDFITKKSYPYIRLTLQKEENNEWKIREGMIGIIDDGFYLSKHDILSAYVLQEIGLIKDVIIVIPSKGLDYFKETDDITEDADLFIPAFNQIDGHGLFWINIEDKYPDVDYGLMTHCSKCYNRLYLEEWEFYDARQHLAHGHDFKFIVDAFKNKEIGMEYTCIYCLKKSTLEEILNSINDWRCKNPIV